MVILNILILILLFLIAFQDIKSREIHWMLFSLLGIMFVIDGLDNLPLFNYLRSCILNLVFLLIQSVLIIGYFIFRKIPIRSIVNVTIGLGDIVLIITIIFAFSEFNFIVFYIFSLIFSLIIWLPTQIFNFPNRRLVPLAGLISLFLMIVILLDISYSGFERLKDTYVIDLIYG